MILRRPHLGAQRRRDAQKRIKFWFGPSTNHLNQPVCASQVLDPTTVEQLGSTPARLSHWLSHWHTMTQLPPHWQCELHSGSEAPWSRADCLGALQPTAHTHQAVWLSTNINDQACH